MGGRLEDAWWPVVASRFRPDPAPQVPSHASLQARGPPAGATPAKHPIRQSSKSCELGAPHIEVRSPDLATEHRAVGACDSIARPRGGFAPSLEPSRKARVATQSSINTPGSCSHLLISGF
jgi:hypothetical protein